MRGLPTDRRPVTDGARPTPAPVAGSDAPLVHDALSGGTVVVRLSPAEDPFALVAATADLLAGAPADAGVLVLAPSQRAAAEMAGRLRRTGRRVALLPHDWAAARAGGCVAVGTRAGALAPFERLAGAVVLDAHDEVYHEERAPTWCAWQVVAERARREAVPCLLVSPCPTLDVLAAGRLVTTSRRSERAGMASGRDRGPPGRRSPDGTVLRTAGGAGALGGGRAGPPDRVRGEPDRSGPPAGLRRVPRDRPLRTVPGRRGAGRSGEGRRHPGAARSCAAGAAERNVRWSVPSAGPPG